MKKLVVANWKMNLNIHQASVLANRLDANLSPKRGIEVVIAPSFLCLQPLSLEIDRRKFRLASQDGYPVDEGSYTGAISFNQLRELVHYSIIGHSERRRYFHEDLPLIRDKMASAVRNHITPILCVGESKEERNLGETKQVLHDQLVTALSNLTSDDIESLVIGYEPVWAIGTGTPAKPEEIAKAVNWIRYQIKELYGSKAESSCRVLYGGSDEPEYVEAIMGVPGVDGLLVGHASLNYHSFIEIIEAVERSMLAKDSQ